MDKENIRCVINIYDDEIFNVLPIIGCILNISEPISIIKCNISCRKYNHLNIDTIINWDNISILFKRYNSLRLLEDKKEMPEYADIYITTHYIPSHTIRKQYNKYILLCYDIKQITDNIAYHIDFIILINKLTPPQNISNKCFKLDRKCLKKIILLKTTPIHKNKWELDDNVTKLLNTIIVETNCTQIIDLNCDNINLAKPNIKYYHCNQQDINILKKIKYNTHTNFTLSNNNISDIQFTKMLLTLIKDETIILLHNILQYMPFVEIINTIQNLCDIKFTYISISSIQTVIQINNEWIEVDTNKKDIGTNGYRPINLNNKPYNIAVPYKIAYNATIKQENNYREYEYIYVYKLSEFIKLKTIGDNFIKHPFIKLDTTNNSDIRNKYIIYEVKNIDNISNNIYNEHTVYYTYL